MTHAEGLARMAMRLEALGSEAEDTRTLLAALQGAVADHSAVRLCIIYQGAFTSLQARGVHARAAGRSAECAWFGRARLSVPPLVLSPSSPATMLHALFQADNE